MFLKFQFQFGKQLTIKYDSIYFNQYKQNHYTYLKQSLIVPIEIQMISFGFLIIITLFVCLFFTCNSLLQL